MSRKLTYLVSTCNRKKELSSAIDSVLRQDYHPFEIVVVSNGSSDGTAELFKSGAKYDRKEIRFFDFDKQLGVARARNFGFKNADGDIIVTIDDDAVFADEDAGSQIVHAFEKDKTIGVLSFTLKNYHTDNIEYPPSSNSPLFSPVVDIPTLSDLRGWNNPTETTFFPGGANAIRADVLSETGLYPPKFAYAGEELDLGYRVLNAGYYIKYLPSVILLHKWSPKNRLPNAEVLREQLENRIMLSVRNLPWRYVAATAVFRGIKTFQRARFDPSPVVGAFASVLASGRELLQKRDVIDSDVLTYIDSKSNRIW